MRDKFIIAVLVLFFLLPSISRAASGFAYSGACYSSLTDIADAVQQQPPVYLMDSMNNPVVLSVSIATVAASAVNVTYEASPGGVINRTITPGTCVAASLPVFSSPSLPVGAMADVLLVVGCSLMFGFGLLAGKA